MREGVPVDTDADARPGFDLRTIISVGQKHEVFLDGMVATLRGQVLHIHITLVQILQHMRLSRRQESIGVARIADSSHGVHHRHLCVWLHPRGVLVLWC